MFAILQQCEPLFDVWVVGWGFGGGVGAGCHLYLLGSGV